MQQKEILLAVVNKVIEESGLRIIAQKRIKLTTEQAENFYSVHKERPFFRDLIEYMTSEPVIVQILSGENCVIKYIDLLWVLQIQKMQKMELLETFCIKCSRKLSTWV